MIEFKACSRCRGDVRINEDIYGAYKQCLQCGRIQDMQAVQTGAEKREPVGSRSRAA